MKIRTIDAWQVFDSRGNPTIEAEVILDNGVKGSAIAPAGASTGKFECVELRDNNKDIFGGKSVHKAITHIRGEISRVLIGMDVRDQDGIDRTMIDLDGTPNKSRLGANAIVSVSISAAKAAANENDLLLCDYLSTGTGNLIPLPEIQIVGGGAHSNGRIDVQDFMIICLGASTLEQCYQMTYNVYREAGKMLAQSGRLAGVADEGGYWPMFDHQEEIFEFLVEAIKRSGYTPGRDIAIALDIAAAELWNGKTYHLRSENRVLSKDSFFNMICDWCMKYPIISIEDPFAEDDIDNWKAFTARFGNRMAVVGDDLFTTNPERISDGITQNLANSALIKLNQIGTVTETLESIKTCRESGWLPLISARSGETEDTFIAHLAVASNAGQLKVGSFSRAERMVKWNELIRIQRALGTRAKFMGGKIFNALPESQ
jgi:enolase